MPGAMESSPSWYGFQMCGAHGSRVAKGVDYTSCQGVALTSKLTLQRLLCGDGLESLSIYSLQ